MIKSAKWLMFYTILTVVFFYSSLRVLTINMVYLSYLFFAMGLLSFFMAMFDFRWFVEDVTSLQQKVGDKQE